MKDHMLEQPTQIVKNRRYLDHQPFQRLKRDNFQYIGF